MSFLGDRLAPLALPAACAPCRLIVLSAFVMFSLWYLTVWMLPVALVAKVVFVASIVAFGVDLLAFFFFCFRIAWIFVAN